MYEGNSKKRFAGNKLIMTTMSDTNRYFNIWKKVSNEAKITEKLRAVSNLFTTNFSLCRENLYFFSESKI